MLSAASVGHTSNITSIKPVINNMGRQFDDAATVLVFIPCDPVGKSGLLMIVMAELTVLSNTAFSMTLYASLLV